MSKDEKTIPVNPEVAAGIDYIEYAQSLAHEAVLVLAEVMKNGPATERVKAAKEILNIAREAKVLILTDNESLRIAETRAQVTRQRGGSSEPSQHAGTENRLPRIPLLPLSGSAGT